MLKLKATSKKPPIAPETIAYNYAADRVREVPYFQKPYMFPRISQKVAVTPTFKRGIVTVGGAAFAWYPTATPFANSD